MPSFLWAWALGSCRPLLEDEALLPDFDLRPILGEGTPFYANLGTAQVEYLLERGEAHRITALVKRLRASGLIVHVNPLQEWVQPGGDRFHCPPIETIEKLLDETNLNIIVKEVGQGLGPKSLKALMALPLSAIDFGGLGGTNFSRVESLRRRRKEGRMGLGGA